MAIAKFLSKEWFAQRAFKRKHKIEMVEDMIIALRCNLTVKDELEQVAKYGSKKQAPAAKFMLDDMNRANPFSVAMIGWFPPVVIQAIKAGEANRCIDMALENAVDVLKNGGIVGRVIGSNMYGLSLISLGTTASAVSYRFIFVPKKIALGGLGKFPLVSKIAYDVGGFITNNSGFFMLFTIIIFVGFGKMMNVKASRFRNALDKLPFFGVYKLFTAITMLSSFTLMFKNRMAMNRILPLLYADTDGYFQSHIGIMQKRLLNDSNIASVMDSGLFATEEISRIKALTSKNSRELGFVLEKSTQRHQMLLDNKIKKISMTIQGLSMLFVAAMIMLTFAGVMALNMVGAGM